MKYYSICIGIIGNGLNGCENDSRLASRYLAKLGPTVVINNMGRLQEECAKIHAELEEYTLIITFSSHGSVNCIGSMPLKQFIDLIVKDAKKPFSFVLINDSCHSGSNTSIESPMIKDYLIMNSCASSEKCAETVAKLEGNNDSNLTMMPKCSYYVIGIFTYNLFARKVDNGFWEYIGKNINQNITIHGNKTLLPIQ